MSLRTTLLATVTVLAFVPVGACAGQVAPHVRQGISESTFNLDLYLGQRIKVANTRPAVVLCMDDPGLAAIPPGERAALGQATIERVVEAPRCSDLDDLRRRARPSGALLLVRSLSQTGARVVIDVVVSHAGQRWRERVVVDPAATPTFGITLSNFVTF